MTASSRRKKLPPLSAHDLRRISVAAEVDPRTVQRVVAGMPTRDMARARVHRALRAAGLGAYCGDVQPADLPLPGEAPARR